MRGVVAAGHPLTAEAGRDVLRQGGNAVDAALAAMLTSFVAEPLLTGFGAGGYMLVGEPDDDTVLLDFFVSAPGHGADLDARAPLEPVDVSFGDANQMFNIGAASVGMYGNPSGICEAPRRFGIVPLADLAAPAAALARAGVPPERPAGLRLPHSSRRSWPPRRSRGRCSCVRRPAGASATGSPTRCSPTRSSDSGRRARRRSTRATWPPPRSSGCASGAAC